MVLSFFNKTTTSATTKNNKLRATEISTAEPRPRKLELEFLSLDKNFTDIYPDHLNSPQT